jgi:DNA (cytosine-5)-methyltransferase 1
MPTFGSLFSGIGGMDLGLERAGWELKWQVEIDEYCRRVLEKHWPDVPRYGDVRDVAALPYVDLIAGGFPCQPVSRAGKRQAQDDERWLWSEFARIIRLLRPRFVLIENVPGLLDRGLADVICGLAEMGFDAEWTHLSAAAFGAPHLRERIVIVAYPIGERFGGCILADIGDELPYYEEWDAAQNLKSWKGWKRWLESLHQDSTLTDADCDGLEADSDHSILRQQANHEGNARHSSTKLYQDVPRRQSDSATLLCEPLVYGVDDGFPFAVDRLKGLGNAVVPQVAEWIGRRILKAME